MTYAYDQQACKRHIIVVKQSQCNFSQVVSFRVVICSSDDDTTSDDDEMQSRNYSQQNTNNSAAVRQRHRSSNHNHRHDVNDNNNGQRFTNNITTTASKTSRCMRRDSSACTGSKDIANRTRITVPYSLLRYRANVTWNYVYQSDSDTSSDTDR